MAVQQFCGCEVCHPFSLLHREVAYDRGPSGPWSKDLSARTNEDPC